MPKQTPERIIDRKRRNVGYYTPGPERAPIAGPDGKIALEWIPQGEGSGLNADMVDGLHANAFALVNHNHTEGEGSGLNADMVDNFHANAFALVNHNHTEGEGSELNADMVDGFHANAFALVNHTHDGENISLDLRDLNDVGTDYVDGGALVYNGSTQTWESVVIYPIQLNEIVDVDVTSVTDGDYLRYNSNTQKWESVTPTSPPVLSNFGFAHITIPANSSQYYGIIHQYETLRLSFLESSSQSSLKVYYDTTLVYESPGNGGTVSVDVDLSGFNLTVGTLYSVRLRATDDDPITVYFMAEVES